MDDDTLAQVKALLRTCGDDERELYIQLLSKTLRLGVTAKTVNKEIPGLIPVWEALFAEITNYKEIDFGNNCGVVLSHYPIPCFNHHYYGWYHLYGHVHNSFEWIIMERVKYEMVALYDKPCNMFNVGCMIPYMDYTPRTIEEIIEANKKNGEMTND